MKFTLSTLVLLMTLNCLAYVDSYREELREMTLDGHEPRSNYSQSRKVILQQIHIDRDELGHFVKDVYCNIKFRKKISPTTMPSANNINIEHTWPRSRFNSAENYNHQLADLHHLFPTESRSNSVRGNNFFGEFKSGRSVGDNCEASQVGVIGAIGKMGFEPPNEHKGNVARTLFYFAIRYNLKIPSYEEFILRQWNLIDPVDEFEMYRNNTIELVQGNRNPFVDDSDLALLIEDF